MRDVYAMVAHNSAGDFLCLTFGGSRESAQSQHLFLFIYFKNTKITTQLLYLLLYKKADKICLFGVSEKTREIWRE